MLISDWSSDVCSSDLIDGEQQLFRRRAAQQSRKGAAPHDQPADEMKPMQHDQHIEKGDGHVAGHEVSAVFQQSPDRKLAKQKDEAERARHRQRPLQHVRIALPRRRQRPMPRSEEHTSELQSLMRNSYAVFCLKKNKYHN